MAAQDDGGMSDFFSSEGPSQGAMAQDDLDEWPHTMDALDDHAGASEDAGEAMQKVQSTSTALQGCRPYGDSAKSAQPRWMALQAPKEGPSTMSMKDKLNLMRSVSFGRLDQLITQSEATSDAYLSHQAASAFSTTTPGNLGDGKQSFDGLLQDVMSHLENLSSAVHNLEDCYKQQGTLPDRAKRSASNGELKAKGSIDSGNSQAWNIAPSVQSRGGTIRSQRHSRSYGAGKRPSVNLDAMKLELRDIWQLMDSDLSEFEVGVVAVQFHSRLSGQAVKLRRPKSARDIEEPPTTVLHPYSFFCLTWNVVCILAIFYDMLAIPLQAFSLPEEIDSLMRVMDWMLAIFWTADILVSARTAFFVKAVLHLDPIDILRHYSKTWLIPDLIMVGLSWFATTTGTMTRWSNIFRARAFGTLRWLQLGRIWKMSSLWRIVEDSINTNLFHLCIGLVKLTAILIAMVHFVTCAWYAIGESRADGWTSYYYPDLDGPRTFWFWYFASSRWTLAQINGRTDVDERRTVEELYYTCAVAIVFAVIFMSIFISSITTTMVELSAAAEAETSTKRLLDEYSGYYQVPTVLVGSVKRHLRDMTFSDDQQKESKILERLPRQLASDLLYEIHSPVLLNVNFFQELDTGYPRVVRHLCFGVINPLSVYKWEMIFDIGDACSRMLLVRRGELNYSIGHEYGDVWSPDYQDPDAPAPPGEALHKGSWLCEAALWLEWVNRGRLIAAEQSSLLALDAKKFADLMRDYKDAHLMASAYAKGFLETLMREEKVSDRIIMQVVAVRTSTDSAYSEAPEMGATKSGGLQVTKAWSAASRALHRAMGSMRSAETEDGI